MNTWNIAITWLLAPASNNGLSHFFNLMIFVVIVGMVITLWNVTRVRAVVKALCRDSDTSPSFVRLAMWPCAWLFLIVVGVYWSHKPELPPTTQAVTQDEVAVLKQKAVLLEQRQKCVATLWPVVFAQPKPEPGFFATTAQNNLIAFVERACKI